MSSRIRVGERWDVDPSKLHLRPYDGTPSDLAVLTRVRNETLRATTLPEEYREIRADEMGSYYERDDYSLAGNAWLMLHDSGPVAAALIYPMRLFYDRPQGNFHLYVVPRFWSHGIGSRLLAHLEQAAIERGYLVLRTTVAREDSQSSSFLATHGFKVVAQSIHLVRNGIAGMSDAPLPDGYTIKSLVSLDEQPAFYIATANRLGSYDANTLLTSDEIDQQIGTDLWDPKDVLFLMDTNARIVGVIRATRTDDGRGYLNEVRLEPASRGKGLGTTLVASALNYLASKGVTRAELDVPGENIAAHNLALKAGFEEARHWFHFLKPLHIA